MNATEVTAGPAESNGRLLLSKWRESLHVTCGLTACTPGSAPGPTLGNEYGKTLPFTFLLCVCRVQTSTLDRRRSSTTVLRIRLYRWTASRLCRALPAESQRQSSAGTATSASFRQEIVGSPFCSPARCRLPVRSSRTTHCYRPY